MGNATLAAPEHLPMYSEMVKEFPVKYTAGGATQNSIRVAQWMSKRAGTAVYAGSVGRDEFASVLEGAATADGVTVHYSHTEAAPTGTCAVLVHDKERSLVANLGAANEYKIDHLHTEEMQAVVRRARVFYSAGFFLTVCPQAMVEVGQHAAAEGKLYCTNLSAPFLCSVFKDAMLSVLPYADIVFGNESEAAAFAEANGFKGASSEETALRIAALPKASGTRPRLVIFTQGSSATVVAKEGKVLRFPVPRIPAEEIVDLNGAGDSFVGGFLAKWAEGKTLEECVAAGHWAAGVIIRTSGIVLPAECTYEG